MVISINEFKFSGIFLDPGKFVFGFIFIFFDKAVTAEFNSATVLVKVYFGESFIDDCKTPAHDD